jgi:hypothetical protein
MFNFTLTAQASSLVIPWGSSGSDVLTVTSIGTFTGSVTLSNSPVPTGVTVMFVPNPVVVTVGGSSSTSFVIFFAGVQAGTVFTVGITGTSVTTSGTISHSLNITVTVAPSVAFTAGKLHWTHHLSLSKSPGGQSWTAIVANSLSTSANVVIRITGQSTTNPGANFFDVTCGVNCVNTIFYGGNVNTAALAAGPVSVPVSSSFSFSFSQPIPSSFSDQKFTFTATVYWTTSSVYGATSTKAGSFAVVA